VAVCKLKNKKNDFLEKKKVLKGGKFLAKDFVKFRPKGQEITLAKKSLWKTCNWLMLSTTNQ
jgi:hypothetical protein